MTRAPAAHAAYLARRHFAGLDGLRALSIVPIIWHHSTPYPFSGLLGQGPAGVSLFFCISGFLITSLLLRERRERGAIALARFYGRRALRIFPLYYLVLLGYLTFAWRLPASLPERAHFFRSLPWFASYTANWFADFAVPHPVLFAFAWSLCVEQQFYCFWPPLLARLESRVAAGFAIVLLFALGTSLGSAALTWLGAPPLLLRVADSFSRPIGWGALLALLLDAPQGFRWLAPLLGWRLSGPLSLLAGVGTLALLEAPGSALDLSLTALVGSTVIGERGVLLPLLERPFVRYVGRVSYGLYLLQLSAIGIVRRVFPSLAGSAPFVFALSLPLALLFASVSYFALERPLLSLRARLRQASAEPVP